MGLEESSLKKKMVSFMSHNSDKKKRFRIPTHLKDCIDSFSEVVCIVSDFSAFLSFLKLI
jgi:hypothetical protein